MTVKTEAARGALTYSRMRGMVAILIGERPSRRVVLSEAAPGGGFLKIPHPISARGVGCYQPAKRLFLFNSQLS